MKTPLLCPNCGGEMSPNPDETIWVCMAECCLGPVDSKGLRSCLSVVTFCPPPLAARRADRESEGRRKGG